jgi:hypothetical protein
MSGIPPVQGVQQQRRRQTELVDHVGLVTVAEVTYVLPVGHIGLGDQYTVRRGHLDHISQQFHHLVRLPQMDTTGTELLPQIGDGIQTDEAGTLADVKEKDRDELDQHFRVA